MRTNSCIEIKQSIVCNEQLSRLVSLQHTDDEWEHSGMKLFKISSKIHRKFIEIPTFITFAKFQFKFNWRFSKNCQPALWQSISKLNYRHSQKRGPNELNVIFAMNEWRTGKRWRSSAAAGITFRIRLKFNSNRIIKYYEVHCFWHSNEMIQSNSLMERNRFNQKKTNRQSPIFWMEKFH